MSLPSLTESVEFSREFFVSLGAPGLFAVAFLEFFLLPVPPDLVLIPLAAATPELALVYAAITTAGSVSAGLVGYAIGAKGGRPALEARFSDQRIDRTERYVDRYGFQTLTFGAFAPIPEGYELLSIAGGVFDLGLRRYLLASLLGRGGRYFLEALLVLAIGDTIRTLSEEQVYGIVGVVAVVVLIAYLLRGRWLPEAWRTDVD